MLPAKEILSLLLLFQNVYLVCNSLTRTHQNLEHQVDSGADLILNGIAGTALFFLGILKILKIAETAFWKSSVTARNTLGSSRNIWSTSRLTSRTD